MKNTVLVVGAAGGVGLALLRFLRDRGYSVIGTVLDAEQALAVRGQAPDCEAVIQVDLADANSIASALLPKLTRAGLRLDGVIVCAAIAPHGPLELAPLGQLRLALEVNAVSCVAVYQACMPFLRQSQGRLIFVSSFGGRAGFPLIGHYCASKFALEGLGDVMRREAAPFKVPVILIEPGALRTGMTVSQLANIGSDMEALSPRDRALYGDLYAGFRAVVERAVKCGTEPEIVATAIVDALETDAPRARYQVGQDATDLITMSRAVSDEQMDAVFTQMLTLPVTP